MAQKQKRNGAAADASSINARIRELTARHSLSDIARRTDTPAASVHRYLNGGRVPGNFCAKLTDAFGLNPAWLLTGKGRPNLADVAPDTADMAGNLLELIKAMSAVEQMQLGALKGKHHLRVLRELSGAMARYDELRRRLHRMGSPVLRRILDDLKQALDKRDFDRAEELSRTAEQLGRLCIEPALALEAATLRGCLALHVDDLEGGLEMARRVATLAMHYPHLLAERELSALAGTVRTLVSFGRFGEARRVAEAALALAPDELREAQCCRELVIERAMIRIHTGELEEGQREILRVCGGLSGDSRARANAIVVRSMLLSGVLDVQSAIEFGEDSLAKAGLIMGIALFFEREPDLADAAAYNDRMRNSFPRHRADTTPQWPADVTLRVLRGDFAGVVEEIRRIENSELRRDQMPLDWRPIFAASTFRLMGRTEDARRYHTSASRAIQSVPPEFTVAVMWQARHHRNALDLGTDKEKRHAREWFQRHVELSYRCFAHLA